MDVEMRKEKTVRKDDSRYISQFGHSHKTHEGLKTINLVSNRVYGETTQTDNFLPTSKRRAFKNTRISLDLIFFKALILDVGRKMSIRVVSNPKVG